jgi:hypothetical protein
MEYRLDDYTLKYYFKPGINLNKEETIELFQNLKSFNERTYHFKYGLFEPSISIEKVLKLFENFIICVIYDKEEIIGFYYYMILSETYDRPLVQLGLVVIAQKRGHDVFVLSECLGVLFCAKHLGYYTASIISTVPKVVEIFSKSYSNPWPNPDNSLARPPKEYKRYLEDVGSKYIQTFFPNPYTINSKRFTLILDKRESGFHDRFHYLPMASSLKYNVFCKTWINYEENEDLIVIAKFDLKAKLKIKSLFYLTVLKYHFLKLKAKIL